MADKETKTVATYTTGTAMSKKFEIWVGPSMIEVTGEAGFGEVYIDKSYRGAITAGKTNSIKVEPGTHSVDVLMGGKFICNDIVDVPAEGDSVLVRSYDQPATEPPREEGTDQPAGEPAETAPEQPEPEQPEQPAEPEPEPTASEQTEPAEPEQPAEEPTEGPTPDAEPEQTEPEQPAPVPAGEPADGEKVTVTLSEKMVLDMVTGLKALAEALTSWVEE